MSDGSPPTYALTADEGTASDDAGQFVFSDPHIKTPSITTPEQWPEFRHNCGELWAGFLRELTRPTNMIDSEHRGTSRQSFDALSSFVQMNREIKAGFNPLRVLIEREDMGAHLLSIADLQSTLEARRAWVEEAYSLLPFDFPQPKLNINYVFALSSFDKLPTSAELDNSGEALEDAHTDLKSAQGRRALFEAERLKWTSNETLATTEGLWRRAEEEEKCRSKWVTLRAQCQFRNAVHARSNDTAPYAGTGNPAPVDPFDFWLVTEDLI